MRRTWIASLSLVALFVVSGCAPDRVATAPQPTPTAPSAISTETPGEAAPSVSIAWLETPLTDAVTGKQFRLSDYKGKPVLLHAFAVW